MRLRLSLAVVVAIAAVVSVAPAGVLPSLRVARDAPLTLQGSGFRQHERVRVVVVMGQTTLARSVRAGSAGAFTVLYRGVRLNRCATPLQISARRAGGAVVRARLPLPECAMP